MITKKYKLFALTLFLLSFCPKTQSITMYDLLGRTIVFTTATVGLFYFFTSPKQRNEWAKQIKNYKKQLEKDIQQETRRKENEETIKEIKEELQTTKKELTKAGMELWNATKSKLVPVKNGVKTIQQTFQKPSYEESPFTRLTSYFGQYWTAAANPAQK